jgi:hypothetical protein
MIEQGEDQWPLNSTETMVDRCDRCGQIKLVQQVHDPFVVEGITEGPDEPEWWCKPCFETRAGDV